MVRVERGLAHKTLFHKRVIGSERRSVDCWYLLVAHDRSLHIQHTWERDGVDEPTTGSTTMSAQHFVDTTQEGEVLARLGAILAYQDRPAASRFQ